MGSREVAAELGVQQSRVRQLVLSGALTGRKMGRDWFFLPSEIARYKRERPPRGRPRKRTTPKS